MKENVLTWVCRENQALSNDTSIASGACAIAEIKPKLYDRPESVIFQWSDTDTINELAPAIRRQDCGPSYFGFRYALG